MADDILLSSQDFILEYVNITNPAGKILDIKNLVIEFNYYEDLFTNSITGDVLISDSNDLLSFLSLTGNDFIAFKLEKPALGCSIEKVFKIYSVTDRKMTTDTNEVYILNFCSEELLLSEQYRVSKSYKNKKVSDIVNDISTNYLNINTNKQINYTPLWIEPTKNSLNLVVPNLKPFQAINWLCTYAQSSNITSSTYLFFQNYDGFNFKSLQSLYSLPAYKTYQYEPKNVANSNDDRSTDIQKDLLNIISYEIIDQFDTINSVSSGAFANKLISVDLINQSYYKTEFDYSAYFPTSKHLNSNSILPSAKNSRGDTLNKTPDGMLRLVTSTKSHSTNPYVLSKGINIKDMEIEKFIPHRMSELALINSNRVRMIIPGDPLLSVGKNINFNLLTMGIKGNSGKQLDKFYSGKYLITAVRHKADQSGVFQTIIEVCKESLPNAYEKYVDYAGTLSAIGL